MNEACHSGAYIGGLNLANASILGPSKVTSSTTDIDDISGLIEAAREL